MSGLTGRFAPVFLAMVFVAVATLAQAQGRAWVQIEAQPTLREAEARARAYAGAFDDVQGHQLRSGWYAIALGPYSPDEAALRLALLLSERLVPRDSFVADGSLFRQQFWPIGAPPATGPATPAETPATPGPPAVAAVPTEPAALPALPSPPAETAAPQPEPRETLAQARQSEAALGRDARMDLQRALQWFGHYTAGIDGAFGPGTRRAMQFWQEAAAEETTGVLTTVQRAALLDGWRGEVAALGLQKVDEAEAGISIDLPLGLVAFDRYDPPFVHFAPVNDSGLRALLISQPGDQVALHGLYDLLQVLDLIPPEGPRERRARSFEISGSDGRAEGYARAELAAGLIKGFVLVWPTEDNRRIAPALAAMQASFRATGNRALDPGMVPIDEAQKRGMMSGLDVRRPERSGSGFYIDARGTVLTAAAVVEGCARVTIDGGTEAEITFSDLEKGIAVLRPRTELAPMGYARFASRVPRLQSEIAVAGFSFEDALGLPTLTFGTLADAQGLTGEEGIARLSIVVLSGDAGGPVLDGTGAVAGVLLPPTVEDGRVLPADVAFMAPVPGLTDRLRAGGITVPGAGVNGGLAPEDLTQLGTRMTVLLSCWN